MSFQEYDLYFSQLQEQFVNTCPECNCVIDKIRVDCGCFFEVPIFVSNARDAMKRHVYEYKAINQFKELLTNLQGKEKREIPHDVYNKIQNYMDNNSIQLLNTQILRIILKYLKVSTYYENSQQIFYHIKVCFLKMLCKNLQQPQKLF